MASVKDSISRGRHPWPIGLEAEVKVRSTGRERIGKYLPSFGFAPEAGEGPRFPWGLRWWALQAIELVTPSMSRTEAGH